MSMLIIWGLRVVYHTIAQGVFFCRKCGGDRSYRHRAGRRYITLFFIPVVPLNKTSVHVQCVTCKTRYVTEVLKLPTAAQMQAALPAGARALVSVMLRAGDPGCPAARRRAIEMAAAAGAQGYDDAALDADLAEPAAAAQRADRGARRSAQARGARVVPGRTRQDRAGGRPADRRRARGRGSGSPRTSA